MNKTELAYIVALLKILRGTETRYLCDGPQGHFYCDDIVVARKIVDLIDPDKEDWTITDTTNPFGVGW